MMPCARGPAPLELVEAGPALAQRYVSRRSSVGPSFRFQWPTHVYLAVKSALETMTDHHCAYCDGSPLDATGTDAVDHFRPKGLPQFHHLVCEWSNLFLSCGACNKSKREQWDDDLLRPDELDYSFERYFEFRFDTGELGPNGAADATDQRRAVRTIEILALNRPGACTARKRAVRQLEQTASPDEAYRFLRSVIQGS